MTSRRFLKYIAFCFAFYSILVAETLDLGEAIQRAWTFSPTITVANAEIDIKQSEKYQATLFPNPVFSLEIEGADSLFRGKKRGYNDQEITYSLSQLIELGGKRSIRIRVADLESSLVSYAVESTKLDLCKEVTKAIVDAMAAQEYVKLAEEQRRIALEVQSTTAAKVQGGKISAFQEKKAHIAYVTASLALEKAFRELELTKKKLSALWGQMCPDFTEVEFPLFDMPPLPELTILIEQQSNNLEALKWDLQIAAAEQAIRGEKAHRIPDVVLTGGYVECQGEGSGLLLGFSLPIPVFDRNQGNICRAKEFLNQLYEKKRESMLQLRMELEETYNQLLSAYKEGLSYKDTILASARAAFDAAREEYTQGKNDYLELLDAQRTLFDIQEQYINTLVNYHDKKADMNRLVGLVQKCQ